ncbi:hypothetical protein KAS08_03735 [Candidatus Pacearchaeota archaeon]|nr:hypothetical protein [Candidatus Pacearchaeota archaeon]
MTYKTNSKGIKIPIFGVAAVVAGFYVGLKEENGIPMDGELERLLKYGPTALATITSPIMNKLSNMYLRYLTNKLSQYKERGKVMIKGEAKKKYKDLNEEKKLRIASNMVDEIKSLESKLENPQYLKPTLNAFTFTAIETVAGYVAGRVVGWGG